MKVKYNGSVCKIIDMNLHYDKYVRCHILYQIKIKHKNGDTDWVSTNDVIFLKNKL